MRDRQAEYEGWEQAASSDTTRLAWIIAARLIGRAIVTAATIIAEAIRP